LTWPSLPDLLRVAIGMYVKRWLWKHYLIDYLREGLSDILMLRNHLPYDVQLRVQQRVQLARMLTYTLRLVSVYTL